MQDAAGHTQNHRSVPSQQRSEGRFLVPEGEEFRKLIEGLREEPRLGGRLPRSEYERIMRERDQEWLEGREESNLQERWEKKYSEERSAWQA